MICFKCKNKAVIKLQHGNLCKNHFLDYFEDKVFNTIKKYNLIQPKDKVCVATSGGKDSLTALYLTKKYLENKNFLDKELFALCIDEGIKKYREKTIKDLKEFCKKNKIILKIVKAEDEFEYTLDQAYPLINQKTKKKPCNICGVWRRYLINKYARKFGAGKLVTGHNLDDEAQVIIMNIFKANTKLSAQLGPVSGIEEYKLFVQRVKPLYFCTEKETRLYCLLKGFKVNFGECPYAEEGYRAKVRDMLNEFENKYAGTKQGIINSFLEMLPLLKKKSERYGEIKICKKCGEPANQEICNACNLLEELKNG